MNARALALAALVLLALLAWMTWSHGRPGAAPGAPDPEVRAPVVPAQGASAALDTPAPAEERTPASKSVADPRDASLEGTVKDDDARPIANAWVNVKLHAQPDTGLLMFTTDAAGRWRMNAPEPGALLLEVEAHAAGFIGAYARPRITIVAGKREEVDLVLSTATGFCGRVLDARSNRPIAEAEVYLANGYSHWPNARAATDAEGRFRLAGGIEEEARVQIVKPGFASVAANFHASGEEREVRLEPADASLSGVVLLSDGSPALDAFVNVSCAQGAFAYLVTDEAGRFRFSSLPIGSARIFGLQSQGRERKASTCVLREIEIQAGENELRLQLERPAGGRLGGSVTHEGHAAAGARLIVTQQAPAGMHNGNLNTWVVYTGEDGRFELHDLLPVRYLVQVENFDGSVGLPEGRTLELAAGEVVETLDFRVVTGISFKGKVLTPYPRGALTLELWDEGGTAPHTSTRLTNQEQSFELGPLPPARYRLRLMDRGKLAAELELGPDSRNGIELLPLR